MITSLSELDLTKQYSYADYLTWQFVERVELLKGFIRSMAAPNPVHQEISNELLLYFKHYLKAKGKFCTVFVAPFDVRLYNYKKSVLADKDIYSVVQPDLCVICDKSKIDSRGCAGSPDLIIEILSPSNSKTEVQDKFQLYQENGVGEYWIVFPYEKIVQKFILVNEKYSLEKIYAEDDIAIPNLFSDLEIDLKEVFEEI
jgi:Uma2 family endonuclease